MATNLEDSLSLPKTALVIEDDPIIEDIFSRVLKRMNPAIQIRFARSGDEALAVLARAEPGIRKPYDVVISDIYMDGKPEGIEFWQLAGALHPEMPLLLTSAISPEMFLELIGPEAVVPRFLPKPFRMEECSAMIRGML